MVIIGLGLTYLGVTRNARSDFERYADLERLQISRLDLPAQPSPVFGEDVDVSTPKARSGQIPVGLLPDVCSVSVAAVQSPASDHFSRSARMVGDDPIDGVGMVYASGTGCGTRSLYLFFSLMLTLAYSIFQGNVGTAYRQRTQIQVFLFIFIAVGWELWKERREDRQWNG